MVSRRQILFDLDEEQEAGLTHSQIAHSYAVCPAIVANVIRFYIRNVITDIIRHNVSPNSAVLRSKVDGCVEVYIIQMACNPFPEGYSRWTLRLMEERIRVELDIPIGKNTIRRVSKNDLQLHRNGYWCILPRENAEFEACMEDILDIYGMPYDLANSVVCMDENSPSKNDIKAPG